MNIQLLEWNEWFRELQQYGMLFIDDQHASVYASSTPDTHIILKRKTAAELPEFVQQGIPFEVEHLQIFCILRDSCGMIHTDGIERKCAVNVPVRDTHLGVMEWFPEHGFTEKKFKGGNTVSSITNEEVKIYPSRWPARGDDVTVVNRPAVVRTNVWHRVDNRGNPNHRYMLSLRFKANPDFQEVSDHLIGEAQ